MEIGVQGGANYYIGDANNHHIDGTHPHIFVRSRETAGAQLRYKFDRRWCLTGKAYWSRFAYMMPGTEISTPTTGGGTTPGGGDNPGGGTTPGGGGTTPGGGVLPPGPGHRGMPQRAEAWGAEEWGANGGLNTRPLIGFDVTAEFNFFEYGNDWEVGRIKPYTPYIFLGVGCGVYNFDPSTWDHSKLGIPASVYVPFGIGFKWKFAPRWGMNIAWQHNLYFKDNLEGKKDLNNTHELNGSNILENDLTGQFTLGIVFDFLKPKKACTTCSFFN